MLAVSAASRWLGLGSGSTIGGRAGLAIDPHLLDHLGAGRRVALVSGTNGKTTTTRMLSEAAATIAPVATSRAGANMTAGLVAALAAAPRDAIGVLEVDEAHLPRAMTSLAPVVVVLLNLSRDQLDRVSEVRLLAERWRAALAETSAVVVANADDPLVVYAASDAPTVRYVAAGGEWHEDAHHCPRCNATITYAADAVNGDRSADAGWSCRCGFARPPLDAWIDDGAVRFAAGGAAPLTPRLPGRFNLANASMAVVAAEALGVPLVAAASATAAVTDVEGRFATVDIEGRAVRLLLAKNPAGFTELLELVRTGERPIVIGINARIADGHDPSWLWDVPFELLAGRTVVATGERAGDLAVRLVHAGVEVDRRDDQRAAVRLAGDADVEYIGNYTAFQALRRVALDTRASGTGREQPDGDARGRVGPSPSSARTRHDAARSPGGRVVDRPSAVRIVVVHPDLLGTYGDGGNGRVLANRARWRGIGVELIAATSDVALPEGGDLYLLGGGEDGPQLASADALRVGALARAVEGGAVVLGVCAGYQILGGTFPAPDGSIHRGLGLLDVETRRGTDRSVGEILVTTASKTVLTGFENHGGVTTRGAGVPPLGEVTLGVGNGDGTDGAVAGRVFGTYLHGPLLARNPAFADALLEIVVATALGPIDNDLAIDLHDERIRRSTSTKAQRVARGR